MNWNVEVDTDAIGRVAVLHDAVDVGSIADWVTGAAAVFALMFSVIAVVLNRRVLSRTTFLNFQTRLDDVTVSEGRRIIYATKSLKAARRLHLRHPDAWDKANHAINLWNTLGHYMRTGLVDKNIAKQLWADSVKEAWPNLEHFVRYRRLIGRNDKWTSVVWLAELGGACVPSDLRDEAMSSDSAG